MSVDHELRSQNWPLILKHLTTYAFRFTRGRSLELAEDLAQQAVSDAFRFGDGWDPSAEPLLKHLCRRVRGLAANEGRRRRNRFEILMSAALRRHGASDDDEPKEIDAPSDAAPTEDVLEARRTAEAFRRRLGELLAADPTALLVVGQILQGVEDREAQADALGLPVSEVVVARRRVLHHAKRVASELATDAVLDEEASP